MLQLRCTQKTITLLKIKPSQLHDIRPSNTTLGNWYIHTFKPDTKPLLLCMNEKTLLSFVMFGIKRLDATDLPDAFIRCLGQTLQLMNIPSKKINSLITEYLLPPEITKTDSKVLLGNMADLTHLYTAYIMDSGGFEYCDLSDMICRMNNVPQRNLGGATSNKAIKQLLANS